MYTRLRHTAIRSMELLIPRIQKMVDGESSIVLTRAGERLRRMIRQVKNCLDDLGGWDVTCFLEMLDQRVLDNEVDFGEEDASVWMSEGPSPS